jgi:putative addiction module component (TIGR02574 family)
MDFDAVLNAANAMPLGERIQLVVAICDSIDAEESRFELTEELKQELDRRIAACEASPDDGIPWEEVKARLLTRICSADHVIQPEERS